MIRIIFLLFCCGGLACAESTLTLNDIEKIALASNPTIAETAAEVRAAAGMVKQAGLYPNPSAGYEGEQIRGGEQGGGEQGFFVSQDIVTGGKLGAARRVAEKNRTMAETAADAQRTRVLANVRLLFYQTLAAQRMVEVRQDLAKLTSDAVRTSRQLGNIGQADQPDVLQAEVEQEQAELALSTATQDHAAMWRSLATTAGKPDMPPTKLAGDLEAIPKIDVQQWIQTALRESPEINFARVGVERASAEIMQARKMPIPDLRVKAGLQQNFEPLGPTARPAGLQGFAEIGVELPIFNRNQGNIEAARAGEERAKQEALRLSLDLRRKMTSLGRDYDVARATAEKYKDEMLPRAQRAYEMYSENYTNMAAAYPQVLIAQRTLFQLQADYVHALENVWVSATALQNFGLTDGLAPPGL